MIDSPTDGIAAHLAGVADRGHSSERVAEAVAATFRSIEQVLMPIVGQRGFAALYKRTLHLGRNAREWLPDVPTGAPATADLAALTTALARQTDAEAVAAGTELLQTFHGLLVTLIGPSLTERLLRSVWAPFLSDPAAQDPIP